MGYWTSRILLTFPHAENSCEINPSHMVFMIFNFAQCVNPFCTPRRYAFCMVFHVRWISHHSSPNPTLVATRLGRDSETRGEKNPFHMENHTKCISSRCTKWIEGGGGGEDRIGNFRIEISIRLVISIQLDHVDLQLSYWNFHTAGYFHTDWYNWPVFQLFNFLLKFYYLEKPPLI